MMALADQPDTAVVNKQEKTRQLERCSNASDGNNKTEEQQED